MSSGLKGKTALITGGTSGIGRAAALALAKEGVNIVLTGRREAEGNAVAAEVAKLGVKSQFVRGDVSRAADVQAMVAAAVKLGNGKLDIAFNNAGIEQLPGSLLEQSEAEFDQVIDINVKGVWLSLKHEIAAMLKTGGGSIINTASVAGLVGMAGMSTYIASKHAVIGLTRAVALEFAKSNIRVNAVSPAAIETPMMDRFTATMPPDALAAMHPVGRTGKASEIADAVVWLASDSSSFVTGQSITIDGGFTAQ